jgi:hypothetical protein
LSALTDNRGIYNTVNTLVLKTVKDGARKCVGDVKQVLHVDGIEGRRTAHDGALNMCRGYNF